MVGAIAVTSEIGEMVGGDRVSCVRFFIIKISLAFKNSF